MMKRITDVLLSTVGLLILLPVFAAIAVAIKVGRDGPVFYRQVRVGRNGRLFRIWKFRTMRVDAEKTGLSVTCRGDARVTTVGRFLRHWKLDELPQFLNVLAGEMSLVGPRPEVPRYVALYSEPQKRVLELMPGITDLASLQFRNEEMLLAQAADPESFYREHCIPRKIELNLQYAARASWAKDMRLVVRTIVAIFTRNGETRPMGKI
jgi:lipopolysaccharide/colanic/teichoic acid biosynthesis glycosyltransferase